jgi:S1/P1 Nuclease
LRILKEHPRFAEDFKIPGNVKNANHWLIGRAGYWPDVVRSGTGKSFSRPAWHYQLGACDVIGTVSNIPAFPGPLPTDATLETQELHIAQALQLCKQVLHSPTESDSNKAIAICWLCHLVADAHQPCHAGSLYVEHVFDSKDGDRGANSIPTKQSKNMHALWDGLLGRDFNEGDVNRRIAEFQKTEFTVGLTNPDQWLQESRNAAKSDVYTVGVLEPITVAMRGKTNKISELDLSEAYLKNAGHVAQIRAFEAAARLADQLK